MSVTIPDDATLDLLAYVVIAKNVQTDEPILGSFDEYGEPVPADVTVNCLADGESAECIDDFKICFNQYVETSFVCSSRVILTLPFTAHFWVKTNEGFKAATRQFDYTITIPVSEFIKCDGTPLTPSELKCLTDEAYVEVTDYELVYVNILPKTAPDDTEQTIQVVITATITSRIGKMQVVTVHGIKNS